MFANGDELYVPSFLNVLKWKMTANPQKKEKQEDNFSPFVVQNPNIFKPGPDAIVWLGHATFFIRLNNLNFLIDPVLFDLPFIKRRTILPCSPAAIQNIDYLLLSHGHRDHLDSKSLQMVFRQNPQMQALIPLKMGALLNQLVPGLPCQEAVWYQQFALPAKAGVEVFYLPAAHWHRRGLNDMNKILWGSFMLRTADKLIYFAGDTGYKDNFKEIKELMGAPDICLMPVGAYKPAYMMEQSHMNPQEAIQAFNELEGKTFIPMHYGTFDLSDEPAGEPVRLLQQFAAAGKINGLLKIPAIGEIIPV